MDSELPTKEMVEQFERVVADEYTRLFFRQLMKLAQINQDIERLNAESEKIVALLKATYNMMPDEEKVIFAKATKNFHAKEIGLTAAVRAILQLDTNNSFYATEIRDALVEKGFDFSGYTSNPLSSIHSVLKRFKKSEVKVIEHIDGKTSYRWKGKVKEPPQPSTEPQKFDYKQALAEIQKQANANMRRS